MQTQQEDMVLVAAEAKRNDIVLAASTTEYDVFSFEATNRPINRSLVEKLKHSIQQHNLLRSYPIVISSVDGRWVVRDGQHRLMAARELGIPIYYTFNDEMTHEDVTRTNSSRKDWTTRDYLSSYCAEGKLEYLKLRDFQGRYPWMSINVAMGLCTYGDRAQVKFQEGEYMCNDLEHAEKVAQAVLQLSRWVSFFREATFIQAVGQLFEHDGYNHARMLRKMEFQSARLVKCINVNEYLRVFNDIYNHQARMEDRLLIQKITSSSHRRRKDRRYRNTKSNTE